MMISAGQHVNELEHPYIAWVDKITLEYYLIVSTIVKYLDALWFSIGILSPIEMYSGFIKIVYTGMFLEALLSITGKQKQLRY